VNAIQVVGGILLAAISVGPFVVLIRVCGTVRRELSKAGVREPELTLQTLSGFGGITGFLLIAGWTLALIAGVLLVVFA
jgi:hypothetical protein